jgi:integrase
VSPKIQVIARLGGRGERVTVWLEPDRARTVVRWFVGESRAKRKRIKVFPGIDRLAQKAAQLYAASVLDGRQERHATLGRALTTRALWEAFVEARVNGPRPWRLRTQLGNQQRWRKWEAFIHRETDPDLVTLAELDRFWSREKQTGAAPNQIRHVVQLVRAVYRWGFGRKLLRTNEPDAYEVRLGRDEKVLAPAEYSQEEFSQFLGVLDPANSRQWRLWCLLTMDGSAGARINSLLHLRWVDVDLAADQVTWSAEFMKQGEAHVQPLTQAMREALAWAKHWREEQEYSGPWVFYAARHDSQSEVYTYQSAWIALRKAETRAGVAHLAFRAFHGGRRMVVGNVYDATGDDEAAMHWIGDRDLKQKRSYLKRRTERLESARDAMEEATANRPRYRPQSGAESGAVLQTVARETLSEPISEPAVGIEPTTATSYETPSQPENQVDQRHDVE